MIFDWDFSQSGNLNISLSLFSFRSDSTELNFKEISYHVLFIFQGRRPTILTLTLEHCCRILLRVSQKLILLQENLTFCILVENHICHLPLLEIYWRLFWLFDYDKILKSLTKESINLSMSIKGQFISTFYNSLTRESTLVLLSLPLFFSVLAGFALLISIPSLATYLLKRNLDRQDGEYSTLDQEYVLSNLDENYFDDAFDEPRYYI